MRLWLLLLTLPLLAQSPGWTQWGRNPRHSGQSAIAGQMPGQVLAELLFDPLVEAEKEEGGGALFVHYPAPLVDGSDVFIEFKTGQWTPCDPPGSGEPFPCGFDAWDSQIWNIRKLSWEDGQLKEQWTFESDWKPEPDLGGLGGFEPVFHALLAAGFVYVPGAGGAIFKVNRADGTLVTRIRPFDTIEPNVYVSGPLAADDNGNIFYNILKLDPSDPWEKDVLGAWLVKVAPDDSGTGVAYASLTSAAPAAGDLCTGIFSSRELPWPPSPTARPASGPCGSQRPGVNIAPAIALDGTIYTVSRAHFNSRYGYVVAVNPDLSPKWSASLRDRLSDGCGTATLPPNGSPGGCRADAPLGVDPQTNQPPAGRVVDASSATPAVAPDGSVLYGAYTRYNYARGHLMSFSPAGEFLGAYDFGWDTTPAVWEHDGAWSVILKNNHYEVGSYCGNQRVCPRQDGGSYYVTQLSADLKLEWRFQSTNTLSCQRLGDGSLDCESDHPNGFEWCINAPAVDKNGVVYANSEDGNLYVLEQSGTLARNLFLRLALGAAYTPLAIGGDGRIYTQNDGRLFVVGSQ